MTEQAAAMPALGAGPTYLEVASRRAAEPPAGVDLAMARPVEVVGVVGAGLMGLGIVLSCLYAGLEVRWLEASSTTLDQAMKRAYADLAGRVAKGRMSEDAARAAQAALIRAESYADLAQVDLVIEAVFEDMAVKRKVFETLDKACPPGCVLATNTSTLDVDTIAAATTRPQDVVGLHFFSPANVMRLLEIVRGRATAPDVLATALALGRRLGKTSVTVGNCYGFAGNRMGEGFMREANHMLLEGASPSRIDAAMTDFGMAMGPFAVADVVGIDVPYRARQANSQAAPGDAAYYRMADLLVEMGRYGQKTGRGFYKYRDGVRRGEPDPDVEALAAVEAGRLGVARRSLPTDEIVDRCILPIINEGIRILQEGIAVRPSDLDVIYTSGYGFPVSRGGPMAYAEAVGLPSVLTRLRRFESLYGGSYWTPADLLVDMVVDGRRLSELPDNTHVG